VDYTGEIRVIMINHCKADCRIQDGDPIAQLIIEKINTSDIREVDELELRERPDSGFGSTDMSPKRPISVTDAQPMICFLQADSSNNEYFDVEDIGNHPRLRQEHVLMSSAIIRQGEMKVFKADFITTVVAASERDQEWTAQKRKLDRLENEGKEFPNNWTNKNGLLYYKNRYTSQTTKDYQQPSQKDVTIHKWQGISDKRKPLKSSPGIFTGKDLRHG